MKDYNSYLEKYKVSQIKKPYTLVPENQYIFHHYNSFENYINILDVLRNVSQSRLKYSRKIEINIQNNNYVFNTSDVHVEIDFELLGVNETNIILELMQHIKDNLSYSHFYVVCLHFEKVKYELYKLFKSFIHINNISFILSTRNISHLESSFLDDYIIKVYPKTKQFNENMIDDSITNRELLDNCIDGLYAFITQNKNNIFQLRENIYKIFILNLNIHEAMCALIERLVNIEYINVENINNIMKKYVTTIEKYNNNYRSIFHIEYFIISLININKT